MPRIQTDKHRSKFDKALSSAVRLMGWIVGITLFIAGAYDLGRFLLTSEYFEVTNIEISGCELISREEFLQRAEIPLGTNIFRVSISSITQQLLAHTWVEEVRVIRELPQTIRIILKERKPLAAVNSAFDGQIYGIDQYRVLLPEPGKSPGESGRESGVKPACFNLPIITGLPPEDIYPGNRLTGRRSRQLVEMLQTLQGIHPGLYQSISEINLDPDGNLTLYPMRQAKSVYLGCENLDRRLKRLCKVWDFLLEHGLETQYIDCRFDAQGVVTKPLNLTLNKWNSLPGKYRNLIVDESSPITMTGKAQ